MTKERTMHTAIDDVLMNEASDLIAELRRERDQARQIATDYKLAYDLAVNAHAGLVAALTDAEGTLAAMHKDGWKVGGDLLTRIRAALKDAQP